MCVRACVRACVRMRVCFMAQGLLQVGQNKRIFERFHLNNIVLINGRLVAPDRASPYDRTNAPVTAATRTQCVSVLRLDPLRVHRLTSADWVGRSVRTRWSVSVTRASWAVGGSAARKAAVPICSA
jgi:hypothetical protein